MNQLRITQKNKINLLKQEVVDLKRVLKDFIKSKQDFYKKGGSIIIPIGQPEFTGYPPSPLPKVPEQSEHPEVGVAPLEQAPEYKPTLPKLSTLPQGESGVLEIKEIEDFSESESDIDSALHVHLASDEESEGDDGVGVQTDITISPDITSSNLMSQFLGIEMREQESATASIAQLEHWNPHLAKVEKNAIRAQQENKIQGLVEVVDELQDEAIKSQDDIFRLNSDKNRLQHHLDMQDEQFIKITQEKEHLAQRLDYIKQELANAKECLKDLAEDNLRLGASKKNLRRRLTRNIDDDEGEDENENSFSKSSVSTFSETGSLDSKTSESESEEEVSEEYIFHQPEINKKLEENLPGDNLYKKVLIAYCLYIVCDPI